MRTVLKNRSKLDYKIFKRTSRKVSMSTSAVRCLNATNFCSHSCCARAFLETVGCLTDKVELFTHRCSYGSKVDKNLVEKLVQTVDWIDEKRRMILLIYPFFQDFLIFVTVFWIQATSNHRALESCVR